MHKIGEMREYTLTKTAVCGYNDSDYESISLPTEPGWIIYEIKKDEKHNGGGEHHVYEYKDLDKSVVLYEEFISVLKEEAGGFSDNMRTEFKDVFEKLQQALSLGWVNKYKIACSCDTGVFEDSDVWARSVLGLMYIGHPESIRTSIKDWLNGHTFERVFNFSLLQKELQYRCLFHLICPTTDPKKSDILFSHEPKAGEAVPSVHLDLPYFPKDTEIHFGANLYSEIVPRHIELVFHNLDKPIGQTRIQGLKYDLSNDKEFITFDLSEKLSEGCHLRAEIYWEDNYLENLLVCLKDTNVVLKRSF